MLYKLVGITVLSKGNQIAFTIQQAIHFRDKITKIFVVDLVGNKDDVLAPPGL